MRAKRVYFLRPVGQLGPVKIGCSVFPEGRLDNFTLWSPQPLELIVSVPGTHADERALHGMFRKHHVHGEWFGASKQLLALIEHCAASGELPELPKVVKFSGVRHKAHTAQRPQAVDRRAWAARIRADYERGVDPQVICEQQGICRHTMLRMVRFAGGKAHSRGSPVRGLQDMGRAADMATRYLGGQTLQAIGDHYGVTRERVRQVLARMNINRRRYLRAA